MRNCCAHCCAFIVTECGSHSRADCQAYAFAVSCADAVAESCTDSCSYTCAHFEAIACADICSYVCAISDADVVSHCRTDRRFLRRSDAKREGDGRGLWRRHVSSM